MTIRKPIKLGIVSAMPLGLAAIILMVTGVVAFCQTKEAAGLSVNAQAGSTVVGDELPTGMSLTPLSAHGATFEELDPKRVAAPGVKANGPASMAVSPDGKSLAILASGFDVFFDKSGKTNPELSNEYLFLFDISDGPSKQIQVLPIHASFQGLAWAPSSNQLFASGGVDDVVVEFVRTGSQFASGRTFNLGHKAWVGLDPGDAAKLGVTSCVGCKGETGGLAVSPDGRRLLVANLLNDSVSLIDIKSGRVSAELDLRPGINNPARRGEPGGSYPRTVVWTSATKAYVASERDREIIALSVSADQPQVVQRIPVQGQPVALLTNRRGSRLYVALDTSGRLAIFDTAGERMIESLDVVAPQNIYANSKMLGGANTNALALTPDERLLLVSNGGQNTIAVVQLGDRARGAVRRVERDDDDDAAGPRALDHSTVIGLVPTGWYPSGVATSKDGGYWYVVSAKTPTGPNSGWCKQVDSDQQKCVADKFAYYWGSRTKTGANVLLSDNLHVEQLEKAGLLTLPVPRPLELARLTRQAAHNNHFDRPDKTASDTALFSFLRDHIKHVIYIMKENRVYDQLLGDLGVGNGDPRLAIFPDKISPNHHAIARSFVDLDNTLVSGEGSPQGWTWTYAAQTTDYNERNEPHMYADRGPNEGYGNNRMINMGLATSAERHEESSLSPLDPDILPGTHDVNAPDGPSGSDGKGYIWDVALQRGLTVRNWGLSPTMVSWLATAPPVRDPYTRQQRVFWTTKSSLMPYSDPYFYSIDLSLPDYWRVQEWKREFAGFSAAGSAPNLMLMWLGGDHLGLFDKAMDGVNTPETQMADNDYAVGQVIETVANSPFANDTLIITIEDDPWDGTDHVEAHRTIALFAGAYVRQHTVVSTRYTTVNVVKTIEEILGTGPIGLNDSLAVPMSDVFDPNVTSWSYKAIVPDVLRSTKLPLPADDHAKIAYPSHAAAYWAKAMSGQDFSGPDRGDPASFNRALWRGLKGNTPYPGATRSRKLVTSDKQ